MDAKYVRDSLGDTLTRACALVAQYQPDDPIEWLATYLRHDVHRQELKEIRMKEDKERETLVEQAIAEEAQRAKLEVCPLNIACSCFTLSNCVFSKGRSPQTG
jgi:CRISPR/Cas system Type II protein with McrA/HNH and RuvC-like nuclease domain